MASLKQISKGIGKLRGGLASKTGKKLRMSDFEVIPDTLNKSITFRATIRSEEPSKRQKEKSTAIRSQEKKISDLKKKASLKTTSVSMKKAIRLQIKQRKKNIETLKRSKSSKNPSLEGGGMPNPEYKVTVQFMDVEFSEFGDDKKFTKSVRVGDRLVYFRPPSGNQKVKLRCTCPDFRHNFSWPLAGAKALAVAVPQSYHRVTPTKEGDLDTPKSFTRPNTVNNPLLIYVVRHHNSGKIEAIKSTSFNSNTMDYLYKGRDFTNPKGHLGFCKHVFRMLQNLKLEKYIRE